MTDRRQFLIAGALGILAPHVGFAQSRPGVRAVIVGILSPRPLAESGQTPSIVKRLEELGYQQGKGMVLEYRSADGHAERFPRLARELIDAKCDVIFAVGPEHAAKALRDARSTIPVVFYAGDYDPLEEGIIASLSRPGGYITGVYVPQLELVAKRFELMRELVPGAKRFLVLSDTFTRGQLVAARKAADSLGIALTAVEFSAQPYDFAGAFETGRKTRVNAVMVLTSPVFAAQKSTWMSMLNEHGLPAIGQAAWTHGLLIGYGVDIAKGTRRAAELGVRILQGTKVSEIPVEQDSAFELAINTKVARALNIKVPESIRARATRIVY